MAQQQQQPPSVPPQLPTAGTGAVGGVQVRCAGCHKILTIAAGVTEFVCGTCQLPQMLPPELMTRAQAHNSQPNKGPLPQPPPRLQHVAAHGVDPTKIQLPCANCKAILNVPHGLSRFQCPQCHVDLAVDVSKLKEFLLPPPPEEVNEVAIEVEREEDEGGLAGRKHLQTIALQNCPLDRLIQILLWKLRPCLLCSHLNPHTI
ncbi:hypothetical protein M0R45_014132 [Rubus argutus]|uniref:Zinc finger LSD1-type domain-containing protein n=1 Tax=Rubus argutus TaxID=59490 RepID=A0AAW1XN15_RUBAR